MLSPGEVHRRLEDAYEKYGEELLRFATSLVGPFAAQDVLSETVLNCFQRRSWILARDERAYLYRAVLNEVRKFHRTELRRALREERAVQRVSDYEPDLQPELLHAVAALSVRQRSVIYLTYWLDLDPGTISDLLDISPGSVHRHLARARASLRKRSGLYE